MRINCLHLAFTMSLLLTGCASLLPQDHMVIQEALKQEAAQAHHTAAGLHAQVQMLEEQLGTARAAQARVQGDLRDSERRLVDAQRAADLHRDELTRAREVREQLAQTTNELNRLRQQVADNDREQKRMRVLQTSLSKLTQEVAVLSTTVRDAIGQAKPASYSADDVVEALLAERMKSSRIAIVKAGDTLFGIAKRYAIALSDLKTINGLRGDRILVGQMLVIPEQ
jgi:LysM repeat protein